MARPLLPVLAASVLLAGAAGARAEDLAPEAMIEQKAPAIVSLKYVLKWAGGERPYEARGAVVDPSGLVVLSNEYFGGSEVKPTDVKVMFGSDPKEWESVIVARDSLLGLAYVQVLALEKPVAAIDLSKGAEPRLGQDLVSVWRDTRGFDFAPGLGRHYVSGRVEKPRAMWGLAGDSVTPGLPLFDRAGAPVGVAAYQGGSAGSEGSEDASGDRRTFLLPLAEAARSLEAARKKVPEALAKAQEAKKAAADEGSAMGEPRATEAPKEPPKDAPKDAPKDVPKDAPKEGPKDAPPAPEQPK